MDLVMVTLLAAFFLRGKHDHMTSANMYSVFTTTYDTNQLIKKYFKTCILKKYHTVIKGAKTTEARIRRLICTFVVRVSF